MEEWRDPYIEVSVTNSYQVNNKNKTGITNQSWTSLRFSGMLNVSQ
jgi:hypothetical protein